MTPVFIAHPHGGFWRWQWAELPAAALGARVLTPDEVGAVRPGDIAVTTLTSPPAVLAHLFRTARVVVVVNDNLFTPQYAELGLGPKATQLGQRIAHAYMRRAAALACDSEPLVEIAGQATGRPAVHVPWCAPPAGEWPAQTRCDGGGRYGRIAWVGLPPREGDFGTVRAPLTRLARARPEVAWTFWGTAPSWAPALGKVTVTPAGPVAPSSYYQALADLHATVMIAPVAPTAFNDARSRAKFIDATLAGAPLVATDFGPYRRLREQGAPIVTVDADGWEKALTWLLDDAPERQRLVTAARAWVAQHATISTVVAAWREVLEVAAGVPVTG